VIVDTSTTSALTSSFESEYLISCDEVTKIDRFEKRRRINENLFHTREHVSKFNVDKLRPECVPSTRIY
jgi:hypothetical protein